MSINFALIPGHRQPRRPDFQRISIVKSLAMNLNDIYDSLCQRYAR